MRPMLASLLEVEKLPELLSNNDYLVERKFDGHRLLVHVVDGTVMAYGRNGQPKTSLITHAILAPFEEFTNDWIFDGEYLHEDRIFVVFDLVQAGKLITPDMPLKDRHQALELMFTEWKHGDAVQLAHTAKEAEEKAALIQRARQNQWEGVMVKDRRSPYRPGTRTPAWMKYKFTHTVDVVITDVGREGKHNAGMALLDPENNLIVDLGTVSAIGKKPVPEPGQVWEVMFLYVVDPESPRLYQPRLKQIRFDKTMAECTVDQLEGCYTNKNVSLPRERT